MGTLKNKELLPSKQVWPVWWKDMGYGGKKLVYFYHHVPYDLSKNRSEGTWMETQGQPQPKREVIKHSAAIQIQNNITLLQRRSWNVLLAYAYDELPFKESHSIPIADLMRSLEFNSKNEDYLKEALEALNRCQVQWNILDKIAEILEDFMEASLAIGPWLIGDVLSPPIEFSHGARIKTGPNEVM